MHLRMVWAGRCFWEARPLQMWAAGLGQRGVAAAQQGCRATLWAGWRRRAAALWMTPTDKKHRSHTQLSWIHQRNTLKCLPFNAQLVCVLLVIFNLFKMLPLHWKYECYCFPFLCFCDISWKDSTYSPLINISMNILYCFILYKTKQIHHQSLFLF